MLGLELLAPRFVVPSRRIGVLREPSEFYAHLCEKIRNAKTRIFLASLYLGRTETSLVSVIQEALTANPDLKVYFLADALRGTREAPGACSASLVAPLAASFPDRVRLSLYKTPRLGRFMEMLLPGRIVEGAGLQHMKIYGFDDEVFLSGANLSHDYFTNRQDRYIAIVDKSVSDYFFNVHQTVSDLSLALLPSDNAAGFMLVSPSKKMRNSALSRLSQLLRPNRTSMSNSTDPLSNSEEHMVSVYPVCQFTPLGLGNELPVMKKITASIGKYPKWMFTAGYFNVAEDLAEPLSLVSNGTIVTASPEANGFYGSEGLSGYIPHIYRVLLRRFLSRMPANTTTQVREWQRGTVNTPGGWSYHAKGFWIWDSRAAGPCVTYVGSSNFTKRGYLHDIECGALIFAHDEMDPLRVKLEAEADHIVSYAGPQLTPSSLDKESLLDDILISLFGNRL